MKIRSIFIALIALSASLSYAMGPATASAGRASRQIARQPILMRQALVRSNLNSPGIINQNQRNLENQIEKLKKQVKNLELAQQSLASQPASNRFGGYQGGMPSWWNTSYYKRLALSGGLLTGGAALGYANLETKKPEIKSPENAGTSYVKTSPQVPQVFKNDSERLWHQLQPGKKMPYWFNIFKFNFTKEDLEKDLALSGVSANIKNEEVLNSLKSRVRHEEMAEIHERLQEMSLYDRQQAEEQLADAKKQFPDKMPSEIWNYVREYKIKNS